jgi:hypothetical protein
MATQQQRRGSQAQGRGSPRNGGEAERHDPPAWSKRVWTGSGHIEVACWPRTVGEGDQEREVLNTTLRKTYKDGEEYKEAKSLRPEELPLAAALLTEAFAFVTNVANRQ